MKSKSEATGIYLVFEDSDSLLFKFFFQSEVIFLQQWATDSEKNYFLYMSH